MISKQDSCSQFVCTESELKDEQLQDFRRNYFIKLNTLYDKTKSRKNSSLSLKSNGKTQPCLNLLEQDLASSLISIKKKESESACSTEASVNGIDFVEKLAEKMNILQKTVEMGKIPPSSELSIFAYEILGCKALPSSDFRFYLDRISKYAGFEDSLYIGATVLLKRVIDKLAGFDVKLIHKYFIANKLLELSLDV